MISIPFLRRIRTGRKISSDTIAAATVTGSQTTFGVSSNVVAVTSITNALTAKNLAFAEKIFVGSNHMSLEKDAIPFVLEELEKLR